MKRIRANERLNSTTGARWAIIVYRPCFTAVNSNGSLRPICSTSGGLAHSMNLRLADGLQAVERRETRR